MSKIAEELSLAALGVTKLKNLWFCCDFLEESQVHPSQLGRCAQLKCCLATWGVPKCQKNDLFWTILNFLKNSKNRRYSFPNCSMKTGPTENYEKKPCKKQKFVLKNSL